MKKIICLLCALALLLGFAACADSSGKTDDTQAAAGSDTDGPVSEAETVPFDLVPEEKLGGTFTILYPKTDSAFRDFQAETVNGEIQNDAVYARNQAVENRLDIEISIDTCANYSATIEAIRKQYTTGEVAYDMFGGHRDVLALSRQGMLYDLNRIEALDFDGPWWDANYNDTMTINGSLYSAVGDLSVASLLFVSSLTFNKALMDDYGFEYPYDKVRNMDWKYEDLFEMVKTFGGDTDGSKLDMEKDDYSIVGWSIETGYSLFYASGFSFMTRLPDGKYTVEFSSDTVTDVMTKTNALWHAPGAFCYYASGDTEHIRLYKIFAEGRALFSDICLNKIGRFYSDMRDDYGILPLPLMSADQERYYSYCGYTIPFTCMTSNVEDPEREGKIIEALAKSSYTMVTPKAYEIITKSRNVRDAESAEMVEIVYRNKFYDVAHFYNLPMFGTLPRDMIKTDNAGIAQAIKSGIGQAAKSWNSIQKDYDSLARLGG